MPFEPILAFFVYVGESFTASVIDNYSGSTNQDELETRSGQSELESNPLIEQPESTLADFREYDDKDVIFQEFDSPSEWRLARPSRVRVLWQCLKCVFFIQVCVGGAIGLWAAFIVLLDLNTADLCYDKTAEWNQMPKEIQSIRVSASAVEGFLIELWNFFYMTVIFGWGLMKELNLLTLNLLAAFTDMTYRLFLQVFGIYKKSWMSYPLNTLISVLVLMNGFLIARYKVGNRGVKVTLRLAFILCTQFIVGIPLTYFIVYELIPLYNQQSQINKVLIAGASPLLASIPKVITRIAAQKVNGIMHPGSSHVLVACLYSATAIVFRVMQAELTSFKFFILLGIGHALIDLIERLTITMRDHLWEYIYERMRIKCRRGVSRSRRFRTPRSQRLVADMSIQIILGESTALIMAVGCFQIYKFMYSDSSHSFTDYSLIGEFVKRVATGLVIDLVFNAFSVWLQVFVLNVAILRVWKAKWKAHALVAFINSSMTMLYFTEYLYAVVRGRHSGSSMVRYAFNCSLPFTSFA